MHALKIENVFKSYASADVLKGINIEIEPGEFLILVGPSGCGKSTLLNIIAGLETATSGTVSIGDKDVTNLSPKDRDIAMVFQSYALYPNMTVRKNISFGLEIRKVEKSKQQETVDRVSKILQIENLLDRKPSQLSGGQRQRVAMGRALARDPTLFLFDEPLSNLDAKLRVEMRSEIKQLHQRIKATIVYVTHDQIEAMTLGDKIAVMKGGVIQQFGAPREIYNSPDNMFVAGFLGSPAMNFIEAKVEQVDDVLGCFVETDQEKMFLPLTHIQDALKSRLGTKVVLGIRPEQITTEDKGDSTMPACSGTITMYETTGPDTLIFTHINGANVVSRVHSSSEYRIGDSIRLKFDTSKAIIFDPETEARIR